MHHVYAHVLAQRYVFFPLRWRLSSPSAYYLDLTFGHSCSGHKSQTRAAKQRWKGRGEGKKGPKNENRCIERCIGYIALVWELQLCGPTLLFIPSWLIKKPGTRIYRGFIMEILKWETLGPGVSSWERERKRDRSHLSLSPYVNIHTSHSPPHSPTHTRSAARPPSDKKLTTAVALRADIFYSR